MIKAKRRGKSERPILYRSYSLAATVRSHRKHLLSFGIKPDFVHKNTMLYIKRSCAIVSEKNIFLGIKKLRKEGMKR